VRHASPLRREEKNMDKKTLYRFSVFSIIMIFGIAFLLIGCSHFGGGKKEEAEVTAQAETEKPAAAPSKESAPLAAAMMASEEQFKMDESDYEVKMVNGSLNWSKGAIRATGFGVAPENITNKEQRKLLAYEAARRVAQAALLEITMGVEVTATTKVENYVVKDQIVETKVQGVVKGAVEISRKFDEKEQTAVVELGVVLEDVAMSIPKGAVSTNGGSFQFSAWDSDEDETLFQLAEGNAEMIETINSSENFDEMEQKLEDMAKTNESLADQVARLTKEIASLKTTEEPPVEYTGVVINAAGSGMKPCIAPSIYARSGDSDKLIYGTNDGRARDTNVHALVAWEKTLSDAKENPRVWKTPLVIKATHVAKGRSTLAISAEDAKKLERINEGAQLLEKGKVIIVL
jgi:PBP1b-binding outer membrane lipoprotein LpoB